VVAVMVLFVAEGVMLSMAIAEGRRVLTPEGVTGSSITFKGGVTGPAM